MGERSERRRLAGDDPPFRAPVFSSRTSSRAKEAVSFLRRDRRPSDRPGRGRGCGQERATRPGVQAVQQLALNSGLLDEYYPSRAVSARRAAFVYSRAATDGIGADEGDRFALRHTPALPREALTINRRRACRSPASSAAGNRVLHERNIDRDALTSFRNGERGQQTDAPSHRRSPTANRPGRRVVAAVSAREKALTSFFVGTRSWYRPRPAKLSAGWVARARARDQSETSGRRCDRTSRTPLLPALLKRDLRPPASDCWRCR